MKSKELWIKVLIGSCLALVLIFGPLLYMNNYHFTSFIVCWIGMLGLAGYAVYIIGKRVSSQSE